MFAGIGGNVLPTSSGLRAVARFENEDTSDWWGLGRNVAMLLSAKTERITMLFRRWQRYSERMDRRLQVQQVYAFFR